MLADDEFMARGDRLGPIAAQAWATGEPGLLFVDTINAHNMLADTHGPILATNPCGEVPLYPGEPCDLGAINLSEYVSPDGQPEYRRVEQDAYMYAAYLDAILDVENAPLPEIADAIKSKRRIGLGIMGLADALIKMGERYGTYDAAKVAWEFASAIRRGALLYSSDAATYYGNPSDLADFRSPRRNIALLTVAPTGTTAMVMGTTSGIEPLFAPFIYRRVGTEYKQILHPLFKEQMERHNPNPVYAKWIETSDGAWVQNGWDWDRITQAISDNHGSVQGLRGIPQQVRDVFHCAHDIPPEQHVHMQGVVQNAFDFHGDDFYARSDDKTYAGNSISKTINLPQSATVEDVEDMYKLAWRLGLKGMTVYRDGSRDLQVLNTTMEDDGSTRASQAQDEQLQEIVAATCRWMGVDVTLNRIPLHGNDSTLRGYASVSPEDYEELNKYSWYLTSHGYVMRRETIAPNKSKLLYMHRAVMRPEKGMLVDHIDNDRTNNTRDNLRVCNPRQNVGNARTKVGVSGYRGVSPRGIGGVAAIHNDDRKRHLGSFATKEAAARRYDKAALEWFGEFATLNFPLGDV